jgi:hypothetical protein
MNTAQQLYRELQTIDGDVAWLANVIFTSASKPATKLRNLLTRVRAGNYFGFVRINGEQFPLSILNTR